MPLTRVSSGDQHAVLAVKAAQGCLQLMNMLVTKQLHALSTLTAVPVHMQVMAAAVVAAGARPLPALPMPTLPSPQSSQRGRD